MSVEDLAAAVRRALDLLTQVRADAEHATGLMAEARDVYGALLHGSSDPEAAQLPALAAQLVDEVGAIHGPLQLVDESLRRYLDELGATGPEPDAAPRRTEATPTRQAPPDPPGVAAPDGSRYPREAEWCVDMLPRRVRAGQAVDRTVGYADGSLTPLTSGQDGTWTPAIRQRLTELGFPVQTARRLGNHVELKAAAKMLLEGRQHSEITINNEPCRARSRMLLGCREVLPRYLPRGHTLTVHGTTQQGEPFTETYEGTA
ncbi:DddA-like double-stranded DNA deaminase toxin [Prauserella cavernicola]|uniref:SCP1.201-like deaminase n=1 Tax=Prauserella cavernicola TaxID=2800127 RepID=A0A934QTL7_9PSEU|nr:DddA-like double-stranded DNA deaminase toxin [Prauserella cavernicola]MBK1785153.1 hypothetical protein [Prauserella cavernicola]